LGWDHHKDELDALGKKNGEGSPEGYREPSNASKRRGPDANQRRPRGVKEKKPVTRKGNKKVGGRLQLNYPQEGKGDEKNAELIYKEGEKEERPLDWRKRRDMQSMTTTCRLR